MSQIFFLGKNLKDNKQLDPTFFFNTILRRIK